MRSVLHDAYLDRLLSWSDIQEYMPFLHDTAKSYDKVRVLELGTRKGNSTSAFLAAAEAVSGHVWSGDIDNAASSLGEFLSWTFIPGDDMDPAVQAQFPGEVDVFFLDTSHEYEHTLAELRAYMPRIIPGGIALFHDTNLLGWGGNPPRKDYPEVRQALDAYCAETGLSWENRPGIYGLGIIRI
jgi:cephalosporin hydroxylase